MKIVVAKTAGYCYGVKRAVKMAEDAAPCVSLGPIIHNSHVVSLLRERGVKEINDISEAIKDTMVIIRSHGLAKKHYELMEKLEIPFIDATCPNVAKIHKIVAEASAEGRLPIIIGTRAHPEVEGIAGWSKHGSIIFENVGEIKEWLTEENRVLPLTVVSQTTNKTEVWKSCVDLLKKECTNIKIFDTICFATFKRQQEAEELSKICDGMIVVGDKKSSNTKRLAEICRENCDNTAFIETVSELDVEQFKECIFVGITAGASTPEWLIKEVVDKMNEEFKVETTEVTAAEEIAAVEVEEEESFAALLEKSIKTLNTGDKVTGVVTGFSGTEVYVDLGTKHAGYIPFAEVSDDPTVKIEEMFKVGDEIECYVMRVNDVEGMVTLSKKRLDTVKSWDDMEQACEDRSIVEGIVTEENKGGIVVNIKGVKVFVPASQTGVPKDTPLHTLLKTKVRLRITEVNRARRRVVGSIRSVQLEERRAKAEQILAEIEPGKVYTGVVKSTTSYGAFVDIGGIDGMVHVSELSWSRIKNPTEVVNIGDEIEVYVISYDPEKKKISLGYKKKEDDPWVKFTTNYEVGSIVDVKIVKLVSFGAFAEVLPGIDGLIHISQIADRRINKPDDVLTEGEVVTVKITDIDTEKKKISLSIRALLAPAAEEVVEEEITEEDAAVEEATEEIVVEAE